MRAGRLIVRTLAFPPDYAQTVDKHTRLEVEVRAKLSCTERIV